ncbi:hypothetical protein GCM10025734_49320 [Kitasatospora paranensis]
MRQGFGRGPTRRNARRALPVGVDGEGSPSVPASAPTESERRRSLERVRNARASYWLLIVEPRDWAGASGRTYPSRRHGRQEACTEEEPIRWTVHMPACTRPDVRRPACGGESGPVTTVSLKG